MKNFKKENLSQEQLDWATQEIETIKEKEQDYLDMVDADYFEHYLPSSYMEQEEFEEMILKNLVENYQDSHTVREYYFGGERKHELIEEAIKQLGTDIVIDLAMECSYIKNSGDLVIHWNEIESQWDFEHETQIDLDRENYSDDQWDVLKNFLESSDQYGLSVWSYYQVTGLKRIIDNREFEQAIQKAGFDLVKFDKEIATA